MLYIRYCNRTTYFLTYTQNRLHSESEEVRDMDTSLMALALGLKVGFFFQIPGFITFEYVSPYVWYL